MSAADPDVAGTVFDESQAEIGRTYADALLGAAEGQGRGDEVIGELQELVAEIWEKQPKFVAMLAGPSRREGDAGRLIDEAFGGKVDPLVFNFLRVLNNKGRLALLPTIARQAAEALDRLRNRRPATVRSATPLDDDQRAAIVGKVAAMLGGAEPVITFEVEPALLGGLVVRIGDSVFDASVRAKLERMRRDLIEGSNRAVRAAGDRFGDQPSPAA